MGTHFSVTGDDLVDWDKTIYNTLSQKVITSDIKNLEQIKKNKTS